MGKYIAPVKKTDERETPDDFFDSLNKEFGFTLDVCATSSNTKCKLFYTVQDDAFGKSWEGICWMNPPYSKTGLWVKKAYEESLKGATVVCLVPSATDTAWWHEYAVKGEIRFIRGRLKFKGTSSNAPFPSALVIFRGMP